MMKEFNLEDFCKKNGLSNGMLEPYDFARYNKINPKLTESMYKRMREGGVLWKIEIGRGHKDKLTGEVLAPCWRLEAIASYNRNLS